MIEITDDQLARVRQMASGDETWDLSPKDCAALKAVLLRVEFLEEHIAKIERVLKTPLPKEFRWE